MPRRQHQTPSRRYASRRFQAAFVGLLALLLVAAVPSRGEGADEVRVTLLETSDVHGNLLPWDYARARSADVGLARVATRVRAIRKETPNVLLLDGGDTIQGTPIEYLHARHPEAGQDPMAAAMSAMAYDAMAVGNHEFNFGLDVLRKAQKESSFPWLSANTRNKADGSAAFPEYLVRTVGGVRVGILGLTTPNIPGWEPEKNRPGLRWEDPVETARRLVPLLRGKERCDLVVVLFHSGLEADPKTGELNGTSDENRVVALARGVAGVDVILGGHSHRKIGLTRVGDAWVIQPGRWAETLARVDVTLRRGGRVDGDRFEVTNVTGKLLPSDSSVAPDPEIATLAEPLHRRALASLDEPLATATAPFPADRARLEDSAILDLVNDTQLAVTGADLSMTSLLPGARYEGILAGPVTVRQLFALYPYENELVVVEIDGSILKECLERAAEFYATATWDGGRLVLTQNPGMIAYSFDVVQGASYRIDPTAPIGGRVKELRFHGRAVKPTDRFTLAVNAYRAQGSGGYSALKRARLLKTYPDEIRELLIQRVRELGTLEPRSDGNWIVAPDRVWAEAPPGARAQTQARGSS